MKITELPSLPERPDDGHKGTFGRVMIVGGSVGMSGAVTLAGMAALRSGAGLVYLAVPDRILQSVASYEPSYLTVPLQSDQRGRISGESLPTIEGKLLGMDACAIGPGMANSFDLEKIVSEIYSNQRLTTLIDADGLNALANLPKILSDHEGARILTPHPGEFANLVKSDIPTVQANREELAAEFASEHNVIVVLKGPETVVTDGADTYVNQTGNSGMGTGGTGDVLTGVIVSLIGQGNDTVSGGTARHTHPRFGWRSGCC